MLAHIINFATSFVQSLLFLFFFATTVKTKILLTLKRETFSEQSELLAILYCNKSKVIFFRFPSIVLRIYFALLKLRFRLLALCVVYLFCSSKPYSFWQSRFMGKKGKKICIFCFVVELVGLGCARLSFPRLIMNMNNSENIVEA